MARRAERPTDAITVVALYEPDPGRCTRALLAVLGVRTPPDLLPPDAAALAPANHDAGAEDEYEMDAAA